MFPRLAALLGYDKTYVSMIETGRRTISDVTTRRHIARVLGLPIHVLGVTDNDDADFAAMIQFGDSTIRLAEIARQSGRGRRGQRAVAARRQVGGTRRRRPRRARHDDPARAGRLWASRWEPSCPRNAWPLPRWTGKALVVAERLGDPAFARNAAEAIAGLVTRRTGTDGHTSGTQRPSHRETVTKKAARKEQTRC
ncbi:helix-turn-helix transcriptional regulator [Actinosynnema sp. CA-248983]